MWLLCSLLCWLQPPPDCHLTALESHLIDHYLSWSAAKEGVSFAENTSAGVRVSAVRSGGELYVDFPLRKRVLKQPVPANLDLDKTVLIVSPTTMPPFIGDSWNPAVIQRSFDEYLRAHSVEPKGFCVVQLPARIKTWHPSPQDATKKALLDAMVTEARGVIPGNGDWWLSVADFNIDDPFVDAVLTDAKTGQHILGTFALNRRDPELVSFDRLKATDIERIDAQEFVGSQPVRLRL
ncbi:MAG: hypothetical protein AAB403_00310 [Planctomycetota bacterium]